MQITTENATQLCYLPAGEVRGPAGYMVGLELRGLDNERLGRLVGVLVDADQRRLRYLVVDTSGGSGRCCLIGPEEIVSLDQKHRTLRVATVPSAERLDYDVGWLRSLGYSYEITMLAG